MAKFIKIYPENPNEREIQKVVDCLREGGVIIYPTDTVYGLGCDITHSKALERIAQLKGIKLAPQASLARSLYIYPTREQQPTQGVQEEKNSGDSYS